MVIIQWGVDVFVECDALISTLQTNKQNITRIKKSPLPYEFHRAAI